MLSKRFAILIIASACSWQVLMAQPTALLRDSLQTLRNQIAVSPYSTELHLKKAAVNLQLGQIDYALEEYNLVLQHEPNNLSALFFRAYVYTEKRLYDFAFNDYAAILKHCPFHFEAMLCQSQVCMRSERMNEASDILNSLVTLYPDSATAYVARAGFDEKINQQDAALYDWERAIELSPNNNDYRISMVRLLIAMNKKKRARKVLKQMEQMGVPHALLREWYQKAE